MNKNQMVTLIVGIIVVLTGLLLLSNNRQSTLNTTLTATPTDTTITGSTTISPEPVSNTYEGEILSVSADTVQFKDSLVVMLETTDETPTSLYITPDTTIYDADNKVILRNTLRAGTRVRATGTTTEGGIEVDTLTIIGGPTSTQPTPTSSVTPSPSPTES